MTLIRKMTYFRGIPSVRRFLEGLITPIKWNDRCSQCTYCIDFITGLMWHDAIWFEKDCTAIFFESVRLFWGWVELVKRVTFWCYSLGTLQYIALVHTKRDVFPILNIIRSRWLLGFRITTRKNGTLIRSLRCPSLMTLFLRNFSRFFTGYNYQLEIDSKNKGLWAYNSMLSKDMDMM